MDVGIRQLRRAAPPETIVVDGIRVPTLAEGVRDKARMTVTRTAKRDCLDFCALADRLGNAFAEAVTSVDAPYPRPGDADTTLHQLAKQLARSDLTGWRDLAPPETDWDHVARVCRALARRTVRILVDAKGKGGGLCVTAILRTARWTIQPRWRRC